MMWSVDLCVGDMVNFFLLGPCLHAQTVRPAVRPEACSPQKPLRIILSDLPSIHHSRACMSERCSASSRLYSRVCFGRRAKPSNSSSTNTTALWPLRWGKGFQDIGSPHSMKVCWQLCDRRRLESACDCSPMAQGRNLEIFGHHGSGIVIVYCAMQMRAACSGTPQTGKRCP